VSSTAGAPAGGHRCTLPPVLPSNHTYHCIKHLHPAVEYKVGWFHPVLPGWWKCWMSLAGGVCCLHRVMHITCGRYVCARCLRMAHLLRIVKTRRGFARCRALPQCRRRTQQRIRSPSHGRHLNVKRRCCCTYSRRHILPCCTAAFPSYSHVSILTCDWVGLGCGSYQLEYKSHGGHHTKVLSKVPLEDRCGCVVNGLLPATRYTFRARAVRESGPDSWTNNWSRFYSTVADTPAQKVGVGAVLCRRRHACVCVLPTVNVDVCWCLTNCRLTCFDKCQRNLRYPPARMLPIAPAHRRSGQETRSVVSCSSAESKNVNKMHKQTNKQSQIYTNIHKHT